MVMKAYLEAGQFVTTHGVLGELKLYPWADGPEFIACLPRLYISPQGGAPLELERVRAHKGMCIVKLRGVDGMDAARAYIGKTAYFARADAKLPPGRYFVQDIIGCEVRDAATGAVYGTVRDITHPAASDVYAIQTPQGGTVLFPAVAEFLGELCPQEGYVTVRPIPGMFDGGEVDAGAD